MYLLRYVNKTQLGRWYVTVDKKEVDDEKIGKTPPFLKILVLQSSIYVNSGEKKISTYEVDLLLLIVS